MVWFVFHKNDRMQDYGSLKFWQIRPREKIHNFLISGPNQMIIFYLVDLEWENKVKIKRKFLEINFGGKNYPKLPYIPVLRLRVNDVGKIRPSSMLCRWTWWTTFVPRPISDSLSYELQNFLKYNGQIQHNAFIIQIFKNSYLPVCAHSRISSGTKVDQLEELYKIS